MLVEITQKHINKAVKGHCSQCPIALALAEQFGEKAFVGSVSASVADKNFLLKDDARRFVMNFDGGVKVTPCTVELLDDC